MQISEIKSTVESLLTRSFPKELGKPKISFITSKDLEKALSKFSSAIVYLGSSASLDHEFCFISDTKDKEKIWDSFVIEIFHSLHLLPDSTSQSKIQTSECKVTKREFPEEIDFELAWIYSNSQLISINYGSSDCLLLLKDSIFEVLDKKIVETFLASSFKAASLPHQKLKTNSIPTPSNFVIGELLTLPYMEYKKYAVQVHFQEILYSDSVNLGNRVGFAMTSSSKFSNNSEDIHLFIQVKEPKDIERFKSSMLDIFSEEIKKVKDWNTERFPSLELELSPFHLSETSKINGKKMVIIKFELLIAYASFSAYFFIPPKFLELLQSSLSPLRLSSASVPTSYFQTTYELNSSLAHEKFKNLSQFSHPFELTKEKLKWENILKVSHLLNEFDSHDKKILIQNFISQNHSVDSMHEFFFYLDPSLANESIKFRKDPRFQEAEFFKYLPDNYKTDWRDKKIQISLDDSQMKNIQFFHDLALAIKSDKVSLTERGVYIFYSGFYDLVLKDTEEEYKALTPFVECKKVLESFPKKFLNDFVAGFTNQELVLAFLLEKEAIPFFQEYVSKNRKQEIADDFNYFNRDFKKKYVTATDLLKSKKAILEKIKTLQEEFV